MEELNSFKNFKSVCLLNILNSNECTEKEKIFHATFQINEREGGDDRLLNFDEGNVLEKQKYSLILSKVNWTSDSF